MVVLELAPLEVLVATGVVAAQGAASEVEALSKTSFESIDSERNQLNIVVTAMTEMSATSKDVARHIEEASEAAKKANDDAEIGTQVVQNTIDVISDLESEIQGVSDSIAELASNSQNVASVIEVIDSIAEQTNLLALNAAIEAARAGDQGRGFAVVADEVRNLAVRTQESTDEIHTIVSKLTKGADLAVVTMDEGNQHAADCLLQANEADSSLSAIQTNIDAIHTSTQTNSQSIRQQTDTVLQIEQGLNRLASLSSQVEAVSTRSAQASDELARLMAEQESIIERFS